MDDAAVIYRLSREDGVKRFLPDQVYRDEAEAAGVLHYLIGQYSKPEAARSAAYVQAVELKGSGELIGHVGLSPAAVERETEIGYAIAETHQGKGYATELVRETVRWALDDLELPCVLAIVHTDNLASIRVLSKTGFALLDERKRMLHGALALVRTYKATANTWLKVRD